MADTTIEVTNGGGSPSVSPGDTLLVGSEQMLVSAVTAATTSNTWDLTVARAQNATVKANHLAGVAVTQELLPTRLEVTNTGATTPVANGNTIEIDNELITVTSAARRPAAALGGSPSPAA